MESVLIVSRKKETFQVIRDALGSDYVIETASGREDTVGKLRKKHHAFLFIDAEFLRKPQSKEEPKIGLPLIWSIAPSTAVITMSSKDTIRDAVRAVKAGAADYITYPIDPAEVKLVIDSTRENLVIRSELDYLRDQFWQSDALEIIKTQHPEMRAVYERVRKVASTKTTVLLTGDTGSGKGVLARLIHRHSNRKDNQFISVHCGSIPDTLVESELFGHEKGAFTGAIRRRLGKFEVAHEGTIFLDEIATLTPSAQIKFLQVLQDGTFQRVGGEATVEVNVRVISAANEDLEAACDQGRFRKDLFYRLNVFPIEIPSLSKRAGDIPHLANLFLRRLEREGRKGIHTIAPDVMESFMEYPWPGNIRELENLMERAYVLCSGHALTREDFPIEIFGSGATSAMVPVNSSHSLAEVRRKAVEVAEISYLKEILAEHNGKLKDAANAAGITTRQLHKLLTRYGIRKEAFKTPAAHSRKQES
jgi:DNA-binding NtrC family response regulator